jgi:energy-coupling factor transport system substrate-specific component
VSWQVGAFGVLGLALVAGFYWYERVRPDARIVALVGTLAAFAALGRIAFAAAPNVKPTTDIVLISGYALGGGPGFAIGALAGLTSNFFFGQGPWTPWQMAAWGATGVIGAGLAWAVSTRGRLRWRGRSGSRSGDRVGEPPIIGRWPLALVCCVVGFAFTAFQDFGDWVTYSDHSWAQLAAYVGQGLGFDAIHAAGCLLFALALGPALTGSIQRFARRLQVTWLPPGGVAAPLVAAAVAAGALAGSSLRPAAASAAPANASATYLLGAENSDGGFGEAPGQVSAQLFTGWAALGLASAGYDLNRVSHDGGSLLGYVRSGIGSLGDVGSLERTILVVRAAGLSARSFAGHDLIAQLEHRFKGDGSVSEQVNLTAFAILALRSAGVAPSARTLSWLASQPGGDGGFGYAGAGSGSDPDDTGAALEALAGADGGAARARHRAVAYLRRQQNRDGGFPSQAGGPSNVQSTAWAIQGLDAAGVAPDSLHRPGSSATPLSYLSSLVGPSGEVSYSRGLQQTPVWVTGEALMALEGKPLPLAAPPAPAPSEVPPARPRGSSRLRAAHHARRHPAAGSRTGRRSRSRPAGHPRRRTDSTVLGQDPAGRIVGTMGVVTAVALAPLGLG